MDDGIDTGEQIFSKKINYFEDLDAKLLYQLCFKLEPYVFKKSFELNFKSRILTDRKSKHNIYYTYSKKDNLFNPADSIQEIITKVKAFNTPSKGFKFRLNHKNYTAYQAEILPASFQTNLRNKISNDSWHVVFSYEDCIIINKGNSFLKLSCVNPIPNKVNGKLSETKLDK